MVLLGLGALAWAAPPTHVRAVADQPGSLAELDGQRPVRVWWDGDGEPKDVELHQRGGWRVVARQASPGVTLRALPSDAALRVRASDGSVSEAVPVTWSLSPDGVARLAAPEALPGVEVADIAPTAEGAWSALMEGGLAFTPKDALVAEAWGRAEGLPSPRVLSVASDGERLWIGTDQGLALAEGGRVQRIWTTAEGLPDDWVQAVAVVDAESAWVGTYGGLAQVRSSGAVQVLLEPEPVYSLSAAGEGRAWVGYAGLRALPGGALVQGVDPGLEVWDVFAEGERLLLATPEEGVLRWEDGVLLPYWRPGPGASFALEGLGRSLFVAAGGAGLIELEGPRGAKAWGPSDGLPGAAVYEVVGGPRGKLWVGTDAGLALLWPAQAVVAPWPVSPLAAGRPARAVVGGEGWALVGGEDGVQALGRLPRGWRDVQALPGPVLHLAVEGRTLWVVGPEHAWRLRGGEVRRLDLPWEARHAAVAGGTLFVGGADGAARYDLDQERFVAVPVAGAVQAVRAGPGGLCWVLTRQGLSALDGYGGRRDYPRAAAASTLAVTEDAVWLGGAAGLERLDPFSGELVDGAGLRLPVRALAVDPGGRPYALTEDGALLDALTGLPLAGPEETALVGEVTGLQVDRAGRVWLSGERGAMLWQR